MNDELKTIATKLQPLVEEYRESSSSDVAMRCQQDMRKLAPANLDDMIEVYDWLDERFGYPLGLSGAWDGVNGWMH